jgi:hypothetical protein
MEVYDATVALSTPSDQAGMYQKMFLSIHGSMLDTPSRHPNDGLDGVPGLCTQEQSLYPGTVFVPSQSAYNNCNSHNAQRMPVYELTVTDLYFVLTNRRLNYSRSTKKKLDCAQLHRRSRPTCKFCPGDIPLSSIQRVLVLMKNFRAFAQRKVCNCFEVCFVSMF